MTTYNATHEIYTALVSGRRISQMDARAFRIEDIRTPVSHMKGRLHHAGFKVESRWIETPGGARIKEYWAEKIES